MNLRFRTLDCVDSTNDYLCSLATQGEKEGLVVVARRQIKGRGRHRQAWISPTGNLYSSLLLAPSVASSLISQLSFVCAVAFASVLEQLGGRRVQIKWPNDLLIQGRKIGGCLIEHHAPHVIVGVGINIASKPADDDVSWRASCLSEEGYPPFGAEFLAQRLWQGWGSFYEQWRREGFAITRQRMLIRAFGLGKTWRCEHDGHMLKGRFAGLAADGALLLMPDGAHAPYIIHSARAMRLHDGDDDDSCH